MCVLWTPRPSTEAGGLPHAEPTREAEARAEVHGGPKHHGRRLWRVSGAHSPGFGDGTAQSEVGSATTTPVPQSIVSCTNFTPIFTPPLTINFAFLDLSWEQIPQCQWSLDGPVLQPPEQPKGKAGSERL